MANIHPSAYVDKSAEIDSSVEIGPMAYVGPRCILHKGVRIGAQAMVETDTEIGEDTYIYPNAYVGCDPQDVSYGGEQSRLVIGKRNKIREFTNISRGTAKEELLTEIGDDNLIMAGVHVAHDCRLGSNIIIANYTALTGHVRVADSAFISGFVGVHQFVRIGTQSMIASHSRVGKDVPPYCTIHDNAIAGLTIIGLRRRNVSSDARAELKKAMRLIIDLGVPFDTLPAKLAELEQFEEIKHFVDFVQSSKRGMIRRFRNEDEE
ncbi:MAG: acyl-ACP--UDP-N-acetylglucosamine O-acyltransferase [Deferribacteraceae bacterium]|jgi:UDP-N-acetylglucosamine acyltransferase|nr:acyl-ACP--UDP-N-acetylglucosamine O-acyltransferase [Deferribacteraceae bacterium]